MSDTEADSNELDGLIADFLGALEAGDRPDPAAWLARHPAHADALAAFFADLGRFGSFLGVPVPTCLQETVDHGAPGPAEVLAAGFGEYELLGEIGRGAMGVVYRARPRGTSLVVALKQVLPGGLDGERAVRRFREEVETASGLRHPHIVPIYHVGEHAGRPFYTMALVAGGSLDRHLRRFQADSRAAARLVAQVARAVHHAHQRQVLHRDLKPGNVLLDEAGEPHVADFGLATRLGADGAAAGGAPAGSLPWMAPEVVREDRTLTTAVDVWALGVILYELLTGARPFTGDDWPAMRQAILDSEPQAPRGLNPKVDRDLEAICHKCLEKDPDRRYESASALALDLERWLRDEPVRARKAGLGERALKSARRHPALAGGVGFVGLLLAASVVAAFSVAREQEARLRDEVCRGNEFAARHVASTLLGRLRQYGDAVEGASTDPDLRRAIAAADWPAAEAVLRRRLLDQPAGRDAPPFATAFVLDPEGTIRAEWPQHRRVVGDNFAERDYFRGARARPGRVHLSRVFTSRNDGLDKLAVSVAFDGGWVLGATIPTDATLGLGGLHDDRRKAVLLAPREPRGPDPEYVVLVHPGYTTREPSVPFPADGLKRSESGLAANDDYADPVAARHPEYAGRWLAGFAPVPETDLVVLVQQPYEAAVAPHRAFFRRFTEWVAAAAVLAALLVGGLWLARRARRPPDPLTGAVRTAG